MSTEDNRDPSVRTEAPDSLSASAPRFLIEIIAWVAAPWALVPYSIWLAILADVLLIGLPTVFGMPGAKKQKNPVSIPAGPAIALELLQPVAACVAAFAAWPPIVASLVVATSVAACGLQLRRWRWMLARRPATLDGLAFDPLDRGILSHDEEKTPPA